jgi:hypothetical protein
MSIMLVDVNEVKTFLEIDESITTFDTLLANFIKYVSNRIEIYLNRNLKKQERTKYFQTGKRKFFVDAYPIDSTATITVVVDGETQTINDDYFVWHNEGVIEFDYKTSYIEPKNLYITWSGGYASTGTIINGTFTDADLLLVDIPDALKFACVLQVSYLFRRRKDYGLSSVSMPDGTVSSFGITTGDLLPDVKKILNSFRKMPNEY